MAVIDVAGTSSDYELRRLYKLSRVELHSGSKSIICSQSHDRTALEL